MAEPESRIIEQKGMEEAIRLIGDNSENGGDEDSQIVAKEQSSEPPCGDAVDRVVHKGKDEAEGDSQQDHEEVEDREPTPSKVPRFTLKDVASIAPFLKQRETEGGST